MNALLADAALADYGHPVFARDGFTCVYCGFDGNGFDQWRQLSLEPLLPRNAGGTDDADNLVTVCRFCNSATSRMKFPPDLSSAEILTLKKERVRECLKPFQRFWKDQVAPRDSVLTPAQGGPYLPYPLLLDVSSLNLNDWQLGKISANNANLRIELTAKGELAIMPPAPTETGWQEGKLLYQITHWAKSDGTPALLSARPPASACRTAQCTPRMWLGCPGPGGKPGWTSRRRKTGKTERVSPASAPTSCWNCVPPPIPWSAYNANWSNISPTARAWAGSWIRSGNESIFTARECRQRFWKTRQPFPETRCCRVSS